MITPLGQRQLLTTAALEAVRVAHQGAVQGQQVEAQRQGFVARQAENLLEVKEVDHAEGTRLDPEGGQGGQAFAGQGGEGHREDGDEGTDEAGSAEGHLDFLA